MPRSLRLNLPALIVTVSSVLVVSCAFLLYRSSQERTLRRNVVEMARRLERSGQGQLAVEHLDQYLASHPGDLPALEFQGRLLAEQAQGPGQILAAIEVNDQLLRNDPEGADRQETRRRLVGLNVAYSDLYRAASLARAVPEVASHELRYRAAELIARELIARGARDPGAHRLLATALEGQAVPGDEGALDAAIAEYKLCLAGDPGDRVAAERLAGLYLKRRGDEPRALAVMDELVRTRPEAAEVRLSAHRFFAGLRDEARAARELAEAARLAPDDLDVRLATASDALRRGDGPGARGQLAAIPEAARDDLRVRVLRGLIELNEERPDEAVDVWRQGLAATSGTHAELTWWVAYTLLRMDRLVEAGPLLTRYRTLIGDDAFPLFQLLQAEMDVRAGRPGRAILALERLRDRIPGPYRGALHASLGRGYERISDRPAALEVYRSGVQAAPAAVDLRLAIARLLGEERPAEAIAQLLGDVAEMPAEPSLRIALATARLREQALLPSSRRSWGPFEADLERARELAPGSSLLSLLEADRLSLSGDLPAAIARLREAAEESPQNPTLRVALSELLHRADRDREALASLDRAAGPDRIGDRASIRIARAEILAEAGRGREAIEGLSRGVDRLPLPDRPSIWQAIGRLHASRGDSAAARDAYHRWAALLPEDMTPRLALLDLALSEGDDEAIRSLVASLRGGGGGGGSSDRDLIWQFARALELFHESEPGSEEALLEARRLIEAALATAPDLPAARMLRGRIQERLGRDDEALADYRRASEQGVPSATTHLVDLLARLGRFDQLEQASRGSASTGAADRLAAQSLLRAGARDRAGVFVNRAAERASAEGPEGEAWLSAMLQAVGRDDRAEALLRASAERRPNDPVPWLNLIRFLGERGRAEDVEAAIVRARSRVEGPSPALFEARCRWASGDREAADRAFAALLEAAPADREALATAAIHDRESGRIGRAIDGLRRVLEIDPDDRPAARELASLLAGGARDVLSWERAHAVLGPEPEAGEPPEDRLARAQVLMHHPDPARRGRALEISRDLVRDLDADSGPAALARNLLVRLLIDAGRADQALPFAFVSSSLGIDPIAVGLHAEALTRAGRYREAEAQLDRLSKLIANSLLEARLRVGLVQARARPGRAADDLERSAFERGETARVVAYAREVFEALLALGPEAAGAAGRVGDRIAMLDPAAAWMPAQFAARSGRPDEALALCRAAVESAGPDDLRRIGRVAMEVAAADPAARQDAGTILEAASRRSPGDYELLVMTAMLRHQQGRFDDEVRLYRRALEYRPGDHLAINNLAYALSEGVGQPDEALERIDDLIRRLGRVGPVLHTRGVILTRLGRGAEAVEDLRAASESLPTGRSAAFEFQLSRAQLAAGRPEEASRHLEAARKLGLSPEVVDPTDRAQVASLSNP